MGEIKVLDPLVADMIAAGEVVERPQSAVKELMENAVDAGAEQITVEIKNGGRMFLRVSDNGKGIRKEDVPVAFLSHATSKIQTKDDLAGILTLGFRGEALASIAAVSKVEVITKHRDEEVGTKFQIEGGRVLVNEDIGCPDGTTIVVRNLFFNVPARQKFLKKDQTEAAYISEIVGKFILAYPDVSFRYINNGKEELFSAGNGQALDGCAAVFGREIALQLLPVLREENAIRVEGHVGPNSVTRGNRGYECFFLNGRYVKSRMFSVAVETAFGQKLQKGRFPVCALHLTVSPLAVDVNVHPQKMEVKFSNEKLLFDAIYWAILQALKESDTAYQVTQAPKRGLSFGAAGSPVRREDVLRPAELHPQAKQETFQANFGNQPDNGAQAGSRATEDGTNTAAQDPARFVFREEGAVYGAQPPEEGLKDGKRTAFDTAWLKETSNENVSREKHLDSRESPIVGHETLDDRKVAEPFGPTSGFDTDEIVAGVSSKEQGKPGFIERAPEEPADVAEIQDEIRLVGQVFDTYIIVEHGNEMLLIDQHAAHERINYERMLEDFEKGGVYPQLYLEPVPLSLSETEQDTLFSNLAFFEKAGFEIEEFGARSVLVRQAPFAAPPDTVKELIFDMLGALQEYRGESLVDLQRRALYTAACKASVKGGQKLSQLELTDLCRKALALDKLETCPHGRPIVLSFTKYFIEKQFKRA